MKKLVQLFVVPDGQLEMAGVDSRLLVVASGVASQLQDLSSEVLHDGGHVDWSASTNSLGVVSLAEKTVDSSDGELKTSTA